MPKKPLINRVTIRDVAKACNLSISTVSNALADLPIVREETKAAVRAAADSLGYIASPIARGLRMGKSWSVGAIVSNMASPIYGDILRGAEDYLAARGYHLLVCNTDYNQERQSNYVSYLIDRHVDGILLTTASSETSDVQRIINAKVPFIMMLRAHATITTDFVGFDDYDATTQALEHLWRLGHSRIAIIVGHPLVSTTSERLRAFHDFMSAHHEKVDPRLVEGGDPGLETGMYASQRLLKMSNRPTAIIAASDMTALGVLSTAARLGLKVPHDLSVIGCEDIVFAGLPQINLTTLRVPKRDLGMTAATVLSRRMDSPKGPPEIIRYKCELAIRGTTAPPK